MAKPHANAAKQHAHPAKQEEKKHGDALEPALKPSAKHSSAQPKPTRLDAVPPAENGSHSHSPAAHLGMAHSHTKPIADRHRIDQMREPPQQMSRIGKQHRG